MRKQKTYIFNKAGGLHMVVSTVGGGSRIVDLTRREYDRFVAVANTGKYAIEIMDSDFGVAWAMRRNAA